MKRIPFVPFPPAKISKLSKPFLWLSSRLVKATPTLSRSLIEADIEMKDREYMAIALFSSLFWFLLIFVLFSIMSLAFNRGFLPVAFGFSLLLGGVSFMYISLYPNLIISKKNNDIERNLLFAIRHMLIQVKSGVSLFDALVSISKSNYGLISEEFGKCTKEISTGKEEVRALEELTFKTPNVNFKRVVWQIVNSLKAGGDVGNVLGILAQNLSEDHKVSIRKYGSQLSPMALMYLMLTVIMPTLGITFLIIFSTFSGAQVPESIFYVILFVLTIFQFMFIGLVKSRRPSVEV